MRVSPVSVGMIEAIVLELDQPGVANADTGANTQSAVKNALRISNLLDWFIVLLHNPEIGGKRTWLATICW